MGAVILLTSLGFAGFGRSASTDMPFTCCMTVAMAIIAAKAIKGIGNGKVLWAYVFLGMAILGKGPVALILAFGIMIAFWFWDDRQISGAWRHVLPGFVISIAVATPWFLLVCLKNGYAFIAAFFVNHNLARFVSDLHHHSQPFYYYVPALAALMFPWSGYLPALISKSPFGKLNQWRRWHPGMVFLTCWALFPVLFFSFSDSKLAGYVLPSLPPLALMLGVRLSQWGEGRSESIRTGLGVKLHLLFSMVMAFATPVFFAKDYGNLKTGLILSAVIIIPALVAFGFGMSRRLHKAFWTTALQGLLIILAVTQFAFPILADYHSTRDIALLTLKMQREKEPIITYGFFHHTLNYYTDYKVIQKLDDPVSLHGFAHKYPSFLVVTSARRLPEVGSLEGLSTTVLGREGNLYLMRLSRK